VRHWSDEVVEAKLNNRADDAIQSQRHAIAVSETPRIETLVRNDIEEAVKRFDNIDGPIVSPLNNKRTRFRTTKMPLRAVEFHFEPARILFTVSKCDSLDSMCRPSSDVIRIHGEFNGEPWFEHNGRRLNTIGEVSAVLLGPILEVANPLALPSTP